MKVVLVSYHFPPTKAVGAVRPFKVARALRDAGHDVTVITTRPADGNGDRRLDLGGLEIRTVRPWRNPRELYVRLKRRNLRAPAEPGAGETLDPTYVPRPGTPPAWKRLVSSLLWLPDDRQGFIVPAARELRRVLRAGADLVYTTAPPFSAHLVALLAGRRPGLRWAAEFRDPWTDNPVKTPDRRTRVADAADRWLERRVLESADHVVCVSESIADVLAAKVSPASRGRFVVARNGIDALESAPAPRRREGPFRIVHVGTFYHQRNPMPFLSAVAAVVRRCKLTPEDLRVDLIGNCRWFDGISVEARLEELGLSGHVTLTDWVPHAVARERVASADLLLLLAQQQPLQVPNKLYEYLGARVPILAFADPDGETARMLRRAGGHYILTSEDEGEVRRVLERALAERHPGLGGNPDDRATDPAVLEEWQTGRQMGRLLEALGASAPVLAPTAR